MAKQKKTKVHTGLYVDKWLWEKIKGLAEEHQVRTAFVIRRALMAVALSNKIPWPADNEEQLMREKWGEAAVPHGDLTETLDVDEEEGQEPSEGEKPAHARLS